MLLLLLFLQRSSLNQSLTRTQYHTIMKNACLNFLSWALVSVAFDLSIQVEAFERNARRAIRPAPRRSTSPVIANGLLKKRCNDSHDPFDAMRDCSLSSALPTGTGEEASLADTAFPRHQNTWQIARRSIFATSFALALVATGPFLKVAKAEPTLIIQTTVSVASAETGVPEKNDGSAAGNAIVLAWVGISAFAGVKGIYDRIQQEQEEKQKL